MDIRTILGLVIVVVAVLNPDLNNLGNLGNLHLPNIFPNQETQTYQAYSPYKEMVGPLTQRYGHTEDGAVLAAMWASFARNLALDANLLKTSSQLREVHKRMADAMLHGGINKHPELNPIVDEIFGKALGQSRKPDGWENIPLTNQNREELRKAFETLAWATS